MKWFKHMTCSGTDEKLAIIIDELGLEGYGFYWRLLEIVAEKLDAKGEPNCCYSIKRWSKIFGLYPKKFMKFIERFEKLSLIFCKTFEKHSEMFSESSEKILEISIPNILKYRDNYTKNLQAADNKVASIEIDKDKDIKNTNVFLSKSDDFDGQDASHSDDVPAITQGELVPQAKKMECPQQKILSLYREILPTLPDVRTLRQNLQSQVRARWNEKCREKGFSSQEEGLDYFRKYFTYVSENDFLTGRKNNGRRKWRCSYAWLMKAENFDKVTSGYYGEGQA